MYTVRIGDKEISLETAEGIFSPSRADEGTLCMISEAREALALGGKAPEKILDLGCGTGIVGIYFASLYRDAEVIFTDVDEKCVMLALKNAGANSIPGQNIKAIVSDAFTNIDEEDFDLILSNPPYHTDFSVAKAFIEGSFKRLRIGGNLFMVTKRLDWYKNKLISVFGGVRIARKENGYFVFSAEKRSAKPSNIKPLKKRK
ncbi:MAG: methyltransferase [Clostridia bacterium]|nr:methyltransferase [Clostridia bacterium]